MPVLEDFGMETPLVHFTKKAIKAKEVEQAKLLADGVIEMTNVSSGWKQNPCKKINVAEG